MGTRRAIEQDRAKSAWEAVKEVCGKSKDLQKKYRSLARGLSADIMTHGLGQVLAFLRAKGGDKENDAHNIIYRHLSEWVNKQMDWSDDGGLLPAIIAKGRTSADYRRATTETLAYLDWLKRFAEAELEEPDEE